MRPKTALGENNLTELSNTRESCQESGILRSGPQSQTPPRQFPWNVGFGRICRYSPLSRGAFG
ncbi:MAG: hypothetical protein CMJ48_09720 [Planctomycetaceae bacterium]|nr:hypothetical protein [Planctomycetaceae bacterium]